MALRSGYKGFKKLLGLKTIRPGTLAVDDAVLSEAFFPRSEQAVLGAVNMLENKAVSSGLATVNADKTITVNGSQSDVFYCNINTISVASLKDGITYKLVGCPSGGAGNTYNITLYDGTTTLREQGSGLTFNKSTFTGTIQVFIRIQGGYSASNLLFKPMITLDLNATYADYVPYAMTNKELTEKHEVKDVIFTAGTGIDVRPATSIKIQDKLLVGYFALKNDTENATPANTVLATISGIPVHHGANWVLPAIITDNMTNTAVMLSHDNTNNTITIKNQTSLPAGNVLAFSFTEYLLKA